MSTRNLASFRARNLFKPFAQGTVLGLLLAFAAPAWSGEAAVVPAAEPTYVGSEVCKACHAPLSRSSPDDDGKIFLFNARVCARSRRRVVPRSGSNHVAPEAAKPSAA